MRFQDQAETDVFKIIYCYAKCILTIKILAYEIIHYVRYNLW